MVEQILEFFRTLFTHRRRIKAQADAIRGLNEIVEQRDKTIRCLMYALESLGEPPKEENEKLPPPMRIPRKSYTELQQDWELAHNKRLRDFIANQKAGIR